MSVRDFAAILLICTLFVAIYACEDKVTLKQQTHEASQSPEDQRELSDLIRAINMQPLVQQIAVSDITLTSLEGDRVSLSHFRGKVVLLGFWTTW